jgi:choline monooxygenase
MRSMYAIDPDITIAETLPGAFYRDAAVHERVRERVFARSWQVVADASALDKPGACLPAMLMDEPIVLTRDGEGALHCLSNVCTHRANLVVGEPCEATTLRCRYHGRRFGLDGRMHAMPEFEQARNFPSEADHLPRVPFRRWGKLLFAALGPPCSFDELIAPVRARLDWLDPDALVRDPAGDRAFEVAANWALYCDNYLEGFHIPFVHPALSGALDYGAYETELHPWGTLQVGVAAAGEDAFDRTDGGRRIAAYYFWLFPSTMLNFYPWGLSLNVVRPLGVDRCRVEYQAWVLDPARRGRGAGAALDRVEAEDEAVVEAVQRGVNARLYRRGRYSPTRETGVHHFHRLLARMLAGENG